MTGRVHALSGEGRRTTTGNGAVHSIDDGLQALVSRGFRFRRHTDAHGQIVSVVGTLQWVRFCDQLHLYGEDSAIAARFIYSLPGMVVWSHESDAVSTMDALLRLPDPHEPTAPFQVHRAPPALWPLE